MSTSDESTETLSEFFSEDSSSEKKPYNTECPYCLSGIDEDYCGLCSVCSRNDYDVFCKGCLSTCDGCGNMGCFGCGSVNRCDECFQYYCEECMGGHGFCPECSNGYYCAPCLNVNDGICSDCWMHKEEE
jgi:hypothetical protein